MKKIFPILLPLFCVLCVYAQNGSNLSIQQIIKTPPDPPRLVNDYANILTAEQAAALEKKLYEFDNTTSNQIVVVIVKSLDGNDVADAAIELGRSWKVGDKKNNNGVVLLVSQGDHKLNISPGYGLEKALPDLVAQQIIQSVIVPNFKGNDYYAGIDRGTDAIIQATKGEFTAPAGYNKRSVGTPFPRIIFIIIIIIFVLSAFGRGGGGGGTFMSRRGFMPIFFPGGGGGFGGGGGGSSGGFGGFGGGSFGGGGSSGSW